MRTRKIGGKELRVLYKKNGEIDGRCQLARYCKARGLDSNMFVDDYDNSNYQLEEPPFLCTSRIKYLQQFYGYKIRRIGETLDPNCDFAHKLKKVIPEYDPGSRRILIRKDGNIDGRCQVALDIQKILAARDFGNHSFTSSSDYSSNEYSSSFPELSQAVKKESISSDSYYLDDEEDSYYYETCDDESDSFRLRNISAYPEVSLTSNQEIKSRGKVFNDYEIQQGSEVNEEISTFDQESSSDISYTKIVQDDIPIPESNDIGPINLTKSTNDSQDNDNYQNDSNLYDLQKYNNNENEYNNNENEYNNNENEYNNNENEYNNNENEYNNNENEYNNDENEYNNCNEIIHLNQTASPSEEVEGIQQITVPDELHPQETSQGEALTEKVQYETIQKVQHLWEEYENYLTLIYSIDQRNNEEMRKNQQKEKKIDDIMKNIELFTQSYTSYCQIYERIDNLFDSLNEELGALENYISSNGDISPAFISRVEAASNLLECTSNLQKMLPNPSNHSQS